MSALDLYFSYKFIKLLSMPWADWTAYQLGLIGDKGQTLKKAKTSEEKAAMNRFGILVRNIKRIMEKMPFGRSKTAALAAALYLLKECEECNDKDIELIAEEILKEHNIDLSDISPVVVEGSRTICTKTLDGNRVIRDYTKLNETFLGFNVYEGKDLLTNTTCTFIGEQAC